MAGNPPRGFVKVTFWDKTPRRASRFGGRVGPHRGDEVDLRSCRRVAKATFSCGPPAAAYNICYGFQSGVIGVFGRCNQWPQGRCHQ